MAVRLNSEEGASILSALQAIRWQYLVQRKVESILFASFSEATIGSFRKNLGIGADMSAAIRPSDGPLLLPAEEFGEFERSIELATAEQLVSFGRRIQQTLERHERLCEELAESTGDLQNLFERFVESDLVAHAFLHPIPIMERVISRRVEKALGKHDSQKNLLLATFPEEENAHTLELKGLLAVKDTEGLEKHAEQFGWIGSRGYWWGNAWTADDFKERLKGYSDPAKTLQELEEDQKRLLQQRAKLMEGLNLSNEDQVWIRLARRFAFLRTWRSDAIHRSGYKTKRLFERIGAELGISLRKVPYFAFYEIRSALGGGQPEEISPREDFAATVRILNRNLVLSGEQWHTELLPIYRSESRGDQVKGSIAYAGRATGEARIVRTVADLPKVGKGDILIAVMTFPHFVPAMERASAFVTNEGGILCHAALVAREMRKPCVIGTKNATEIFKDGDMVEVDAEKGVVRKLE